MENGTLSMIFNFIGFTIVTSLVSWLLSKVYEMDRNVRSALSVHFKQVEEALKKEKEESVLAHRRVDVLDESVGEFSDFPFNSRHVAEGRQPNPSFKRLQKTIYTLESDHEHDV